MMLRPLIFLGLFITCSSETLSGGSKQKRSLIEIGQASAPPSYGYGSPWSRSRNPWKTLKISSDLYQSSSAPLSYGSARPAPPLPSPSILVTKHVIVEKPVPVPGQPVLIEKPVPVHVPIHIPVEKIVPVTVEKSVPVPVPHIIPYPVERAVPIRQGIPYPIPVFIAAPTGLALGTSIAPSPSLPAAAPVPSNLLSSISALPSQLLRQPSSTLQAQPQPAQAAPPAIQPINLSVTAGVSQGIPVQMQMQNGQIARGILQGLDSGLPQIQTLETVPESIQGNNLPGLESLILDDWKLD